MSTVDPIAAHRARRLSRQGQPQILVWAIVAGVVQLGAAFCAGLAIGTMVNLLRSGVIDSSLADNDPGVGGVLGLATMPVLIFGGVFGLIISGAATRYLVDAYTGGEKQPIRQTVAVAWLVAVGLLVHTTTWTTPLAVGTERWVTRRAENRASIPTADTALVLFDPLQPDADDLIFVAFLPDPLPGDWIGTVA